MINLQFFLNSYNQSTTYHTNTNHTSAVKRTIPNATFKPVFSARMITIHILQKIIIIINLHTAAFKAYCAIWFTHSNFRHQASPRVTMREHPAAEGGTVGKKCPDDVRVDARNTLSHT
jgi:hypothetical protein